MRRRNNSREWRGLPPTSSPVIDRRYNGHSERRNHVTAYDFILYDKSERKRSYEGRTASAAASAARRRNWLNWARAVSSSNKQVFHGDEPDVGADGGKGGPRA